MKALKRLIECTDSSDPWLFTNELVPKSHVLTQLIFSLLCFVVDGEHCYQWMIW